MGIETGSGGRKLVLDEAALRAQLAEIRAERARLDARERALLGALDLFENGIGQLDEAPTPPDQEIASNKSQRDMIRHILDTTTAENGELSISEIILAISETFGVDLHRTSVSPTLTKLEAAGEVWHIGRKWRAAKDGLFSGETGSGG